MAGAVPGNCFHPASAAVTYPFLRVLEKANKKKKERTKKEKKMLNTLAQKLQTEKKTLLS